MKKNDFFITGNATKYWKKEVKNGRLQIATKEDKIYILNGYNAFIIPNNAFVYELLVQPATLRPAPEDGRAHIWINGIMREDSAADTINIIDRLLTAETAPVERTRWTVDAGDDKTLRIYKRQRGDVIGIDTKYDSMVDFSFRHSGTMAGNKCPAIFTSGDFIALLLPVNNPSITDWARALLEV